MESTTYQASECQQRLRAYTGENPWEDVIRSSQFDLDENTATMSELLLPMVRCWFGLAGNGSLRCLMEARTKKPLDPSTGNAYQACIAVMLSSRL
jgi:hypothetical protein